MSEVDRAALMEACKLYGEEDRQRANFLADMIETLGFDNAARIAVYHLQHENLCLKPAQRPVCVLDPSGECADCDQGSQQLLRRMLKLGLSRYCPDPLTAIARAGNAA